MTVGRDGRQGWSRRAEEAWVRVFEPGPKSVAFPDAVERKIVEGFARGQATDDDAQGSGAGDR